MSTKHAVPSCPFCQGPIKSPAYGQQATCPHCGSHFRTQPPAKMIIIVLAIGVLLAAAVVLTVVLL